MFASGRNLHSVTQEERPTALQSLDESVLDRNVPMDGNKVKLSCDAIMENGSKRCNFQTSKLKKSKAKQRLAAHIFAKHSKESVPD